MTRFKFQTVFVAIGITLFCGTGCASLNSLFSNDSGDEIDPAKDPVAAAALQLRRPASDSGSDAAENQDHARSRRLSAPADTIRFGMAMDEVTAVWGEPSEVDTAGDPVLGNQRWTYYSGLASRYGLGNKRIVYFESGHVAGWHAL